MNDELVMMSPSGDAHGYAAFEIAVSLREHARHAGAGRAIADHVGFLVNLPHRRSFSPDAAFHTGAFYGSGFIEGAPLFAVEVRSEEDDGVAADRAMAAKRADYFAAGTIVVWDVDVLRERTVRVFRATAPAAPTVHGINDRADAEPAVPGWSMAVIDLIHPSQR